MVTNVVRDGTPQNAQVQSANPTLIANRVTRPRSVHASESDQWLGDERVDFMSVVESGVSRREG